MVGIAELWTLLQGGHFYIQMDYCEGGSLHQYLYSDESPRVLSDEQLWKVALEVATGLDFLHQNNVLHLDIKPENLYRNINEKGEPGPWKIGDFGLAVAKESNEWEEGDGDYVAPELLKSGSEPSPSADIFSLAATLYECATGEVLPRMEKSPDAKIPRLENRQDEFQTLLSAMTLHEPSQRPLACQVAAYAKEMLHMTNLMPASGKSKDKKRAHLEKNELPSLSPLHSNCGHTPGAAAGLVGLTPKSEKADALPKAGEIEKSKSQNLRLPLLNISANPAGASNASTARTSETGNNFRIRRRDFASPGRELQRRLFD